jgi:hypothetical protein
MSIHKPIRILSPRWAPAGLFSYVWGCLQSMYLFPDDQFIVDMRKFSTYYDPSIAHTCNVWEYYWEQPPITRSDDDTFLIGLWNEGDSGYSDIEIITDEKKQRYNKLIATNLRLLPHIQEKIDSFMSINDWKSKKVLGVHCRGSDGGGLQSPSFYVEEAKLIENQFDIIFVASCDELYLQAFRNEFGDKVIVYEYAPRSKNGSALWLRPSAPYVAGEGAIIDAYLLSNTNFMIHPTSNVSTFAKYVNLNLETLNIYKKHGIKYPLI